MACECRVIVVVLAAGNFSYLPKIIMKTGELIRQLRQKKGITQEELAARTEISVRTIQRIESGEVDPRAYTLQTIATALEVNFEVLAGSDPSIGETGRKKKQVASIASSQWSAVTHHPSCCHLDLEARRG